MGPVSCGKLAGAVSAALTSLTIAQNPIGGPEPLLSSEALKSSNMQSIVIGKDLRLIICGRLDSASLDASKQDISPGYAIIMAWWLTLPVSAALTSLNVSGILCPARNTIVPVIEQHDLNLSGLIELGKGIAASTTLSSINFAECHLGPKAAMEVAKICAASAR